MGAFEALCWVKYLLTRLPPKEVLEAIDDAIQVIGAGVAEEFAYKHGLRFQNMIKNISNSNRSSGKKEHREY